MTPPRFPGAPEGSYVCDEGWLIVGDEAWTENEWRVESPRARYDRERRRSPARRKKLREYLRRYRAKGKAA